MQKKAADKQEEKDKYQPDPIIQRKKKQSEPTWK